MRDGLRVLGIGIRREPRVFTIAVVGSALFGALTVADAWVLGYATENALTPSLREGEIQTSALLVACALFMGVALVRAVGIVVRRLAAGIMQLRMEAHDRKAVTRQYLALPMSWHHRHPTGRLLSNANSDVEAAWTPIAPLPMAVGVLVMMVVAIGQMLLTDLVLALVGLAVFPAVIATNLVYQRYASPLQRDAQRLRGRVAEVAHESFDGALVVKTLGREAEETARFAEQTSALRDALVRAGRVQAVFDPVMEQLPNLGVLFTLGIGALRVQSGDANVADVVTVAYLLVMVGFPIRAIGWLLGSFPRSVVGHERVSRVLAEREDMGHGVGRLADRGASGHGIRVEVDALTYRYPDASPDADPVLGDLSFDVEPGRTVALVGATASGKSTLTTLLTRLVDPTGGEIRYDGVPLPALARGALAEQVAVVPQTAFLFDGTVRFNVALDAEHELSDEEIWDALRAAQADGFVAALPRGLDTALGERGTSLSGGQRQRLALARALVRHPRLLVLDDATSAVDPEVEQRILAAIRGREGGATLVLVAYRLATIALADEVVHLDGGRVVDRGTHAELLARDAAYADLVTAYAEDAPEALDPEAPEVVR
ncbi:ABC transporter ATP-binding protein/permease [Nocardioidaceae bacterium]|nr:ABC transporter ATP-binding protein/permease [Nocardioidaceae bacterium]